MGEKYIYTDEIKQGFFYHPELKDKPHHHMWKYSGCHVNRVCRRCGRIEYQVHLGIWLNEWLGLPKNIDEYIEREKSVNTSKEPSNIPKRKKPQEVVIPLDSRYRVKQAKRLLGEKNERVSTY